MMDAVARLDSVVRKLLGLLQAEFPLTREPYTDIGITLGVNGDDVIQHIRRLKLRGIVRQIGPVMDARQLGYRSTLVAMKVPGERLATAERLIVEHPGVSHGYERDNDFNIWITLCASRGGDINYEINRLAAAAGAESVFDLPAIKVFKLRAYFGVDDGDLPAETRTEIARLAKPAELSTIDRAIINCLQQDLPLAPSPFASLAASLGMVVDDFLLGCRSLLQRGVMRRFGASINHNQAGYPANAMTCWAVPGKMVDDFGKRLASLSEVSHCYERRTGYGWRYNLFAMVHGRAKPDCQKLVKEVCLETGLADYAMLFSTRELKKTRIKYVV